MNEKFKRVYYYEKANDERYHFYYKSYPHLSLEDVVWRVNAHLDYNFYTNICDTNTNQFPLLVNKYYALPTTYTPNHLVNFPHSDYRACQETVDAFLLLQAEAKKEQLNLSVLSAYRSFDYQKKLYEQYCLEDGKKLADTYSARPRHSEHETGYALDICVTNHELDQFQGTKESDWLNKNAHHYGFIIRYPQGLSYLTGYQYEPWHITYVGKEIAMTMKQNRIKILEEYIVKYIDHHQ